MTLITPPAVRPNSALAPLATTWNSFTASRVMSIASALTALLPLQRIRCCSRLRRGLTLLKIPRCPLKLISSPSGPWVIETPGVSVSRSSNLRPSTGVELTVSSLIVEEDSVLVTSTIGTSVTTICCATEETFMVTGKVIVCPMVRFTFS